LTTAAHEASRVLVVDDSPSLRRMLELTLRRDGFEVQCAGDGREALEVAAHGYPDAVLCDVDMPHMDGLELTEILVAANAEAAVVLMSGSGAADLRQRAERAGACDFLVKPFERDELLDSIDRALARRTQRIAS
jgi:DNA-binding NtrC family response regulator